MKKHFAVIAILGAMVLGGNAFGQAARTMTVNVNIVPDAQSGQSVVAVGGQQQPKPVAAKPVAVAQPVAAETEKPAEADAETAPVAEAPAATVDPAHDKIAAMEKQEELGKDETKKTSNPAKAAIQMILKLVIVLALAYVTMLALKWGYSRREITPNTKGSAKIIDTVKLSPTNAVHVLDIKGKTLILGSTAGQVNLLCELEKAAQKEPQPHPVIVQEVAPELEPEPVVIEEQPKPGTAFADYLAKYSGPSNQTGTTGRIAGMLRDCVSHMQSKRTDVMKSGFGVTNANHSSANSQQTKPQSFGSRWVKNCALYLEGRMGGKRDA